MLDNDCDLMDRKAAPPPESLAARAAEGGLWKSAGWQGPTECERFASFTFDERGIVVPPSRIVGGGQTSSTRGLTAPLIECMRPNGDVGLVGAAKGFWIRAHGTSGVWLNVAVPGQSGAVRSAAEQTPGGCRRVLPD